jgi:DNA polymerase elongation subunit (family B)
MQAMNNATNYFFDIETSVDEKTEIMIRRQAESDYPIRPDDCAAFTPEQYSEKRVRDACLKAEYARVLVASLIVEDKNEVVKRCLIGLDPATGRFYENESQALQRIWNHLAHFNLSADILVGHNILNFDLPFLYKRSIINHVQPTIYLNFARYRAQPIFDTMHIWQRWNGAISLDALATALSLTSSKNGGINGSQVYDFYRAGKHREIADYCGRDTILVREIYQRMTFAE